MELWHNDHHASPRYANAIPAGKIVQIRAEQWYPCFVPQIDGFDISCDAYCYVYGNVSSLNGLNYTTNTYGVPSYLFYKNWRIKNHPEKTLYLGNYCGSYAFYGCTSLTSITIPSSLTNIGEKAFSGCANLATITSEITSPFIIDDILDGNYSNTTLIVPQNTKSSYQATEGWKKFTNIVEVGEGGIVGQCFYDDGLKYKIGENNTVSVISCTNQNIGVI